MLDVITVDMESSLQKGKGKGKVDNKNKRAMEEKVEEVMMWEENVTSCEEG